MKREKLIYKEAAAISIIGVETMRIVASSPFTGGHEEPEPGGDVLETPKFDWENEGKGQNSPWNTTLELGNN